MLHCTAQIAQLREVHLLRNVIGDAGAAAFGRTVGSGATVHVLALGSRITDVGFEALGEGIARSAHLRELLVSDNSISPEVRQSCADTQRGADGGTTCSCTHTTCDGGGGGWGFLRVGRVLWRSLDTRL